MILIIVHSHHIWSTVLLWLHPCTKRCCNITNQKLHTAVIPTLTYNHLKEAGSCSGSLFLSVCWRWQGPVIKPQYKYIYIRGKNYAGSHNSMYCKSSTFLNSKPLLSSDAKSNLFVSLRMQASVNFVNYFLHPILFQECHRGRSGLHSIVLGNRCFKAWAWVEDGKLSLIVHMKKYLVCHVTIE